MCLKRMRIEREKENDNEDENVSNMSSDNERLTFLIPSSARSWGFFLFLCSHNLNKYDKKRQGKRGIVV